MKGDAMLYVFEGSRNGWYVVDDVPGPNGFRRFVSERFTDRDDAERRALRLAVESGVGASTTEDCLGVHVNDTDGKDFAMATTKTTRYSTFGYLASDGVTVYAFYHSNPDGSVTWDHPADASAECKVCAATPARDTAGMIVDQRAVDTARGLTHAMQKRMETPAALTRAMKDRTKTDASHSDDVPADDPDAAREALVDAMAASIAEESEDGAARVAMLARLAEEDEDTAEDNRGGSDDDDVETR